jgi:glycosyltransferase involved in cell wall biosynthesis
MFKIACIPVYNEEKIIGEIVKKCMNYVDKVIVCDDGSTDNTARVAKENGAHVIQHKKNTGKGSAMRSLFKSALENNGDVIVTIDGDGQFLPEEIPIIMDPVLKNQSDIVIGYRFDDKTEMPTYRRIGNKMLDKISNFASDLPFRDTQSGFRAYSKKAIQMIKFTADGFGADSEILIDASRKELIISEEKITVIYNTGGKTSTQHPITHSSSVISTLIELIAIRQPLRYLGVPGVILFIIGIIYSIVVIAIFNDTRYFSIPSTLIALGSVMIGIILLLMSVVLFSINRVLKREN